VNRAALSLLAVIVGIVCVLVAAFAVDWRLGLATLGVLAILFGYLVDAPDTRDPVA